MMKTKYLRIAVAIGCLAFVAFVIYRVFGRPMRYEIPAGFKGWLLVRFADGTCQPLRRQGVFLVVSLPPSGWVCTSTQESDGLVFYRFEYVYPNGTRQSLRWNQHGKSGTQVWLLGTGLENKTQEIFVGDEHENWNHYPKPNMVR
jgi:hypothetical protein